MNRPPRGPRFPGSSGRAETAGPMAPVSHMSGIYPGRGVFGLYGRLFLGSLVALMLCPGSEPKIAGPNLDPRF